MLFSRFFCHLVGRKKMVLMRVALTLLLTSAASAFVAVPGLACRGRSTVTAPPTMGLRRNKASREEQQSGKLLTDMVFGSAAESSLFPSDNPVPGGMPDLSAYQRKKREPLATETDAKGDDEEEKPSKTEA